MGFVIPTDSTCSSLESVKRDTHKSLDANEATPCYDAMLRAYSKHALLLRPSSSSKIIPASTDVLTRARYILLNHMPNEGISITNHTCNAVLSGYSAMGMGSEAKQLLLEIEALHLSPLYSNQKLPSSLRPSSLDTACYNSVLHGYSLEKNGVRSAEELLTAMKEQQPFPVSIQNITVNSDVEEGSSSIKIVPPAPDMISYVSMLNCYGKNGMGGEAYDLLRQIERPTSACYLATIRALQRCSDPTAPDKSLSLVEQLEINRNNDGSVSKRRMRSTVTLNRQLFHASMQCMIRHGQGSKAEDILYRFNSHSTRDQNDIQPFILALKAYENTKAINSRREAAESAERLLRKMQSIGHHPRSIEAYKIVTNCFARAGMSAPALKLVKELDSIGNVAASEFYDLVIKAISLSDDKNAVSQAWAILHQLGYPQKNAKDVEPFDIPITTFNSMLKLFARRGMANEAEALLQEIDEFIIQGKSKGSGPDIQSYEAVLEALGKTNDSDAVERAEALVTRVEVMSELGGGGMQQPSLKMYNELLNVYGESGKVGSAERLLARLHEQSLNPDAFSYATTIKALKNSGKSKDIAVARAKELAQALDQSSNGARINEIIFAHRLSILAKFGLAAQAENLLQEMRHKHKTGELKQGPGVIHHTAVLNAWAKSDDRKATSRAEALFEKMKADPNLELDLAAYHGLLLNYSVRGMSPKARRLLQAILDSEIEPNRNTFTMVIDSYSRSSSTANAGVKAEELLDQMRQLHAAGNANVEPDSVSYASVIRCKQASTSKPINELTEFDKLQLMRELQIENWPFQ
jgi:pentatricopeptide repeat protein